MCIRSTLKFFGYVDELLSFCAYRLVLVKKGVTGAGMHFIHLLLPLFFKLMHTSTAFCGSGIQELPYSFVFFKAQAIHMAIVVDPFLLFHFK